MDNIKKVVCEFYGLSDIREAKCLLCEELVRILAPDVDDLPQAELSKHVVPELPRMVTHSKGDNCTQAEVTDLMELVNKADELNVLVKLPIFVAASYDRLPMVKPEDLDICLLANRLSRFEDTVAGHSRHILGKMGQSGQGMGPTEWCNVIDQIFHTDIQLG